ncbi:phosphatase domain-containing protein [Qipengyuania sp. JC766]|uniref:phosphatase domain-containing protein n=1 Tax=Qipengyuania sp. JC766 TaxID=3232139 RepID=UPI0034599290
MPFFPRAPVRIQPYFGYRNRTALHISARALRAAPSNFSRTGGTWQAIRTMLAQFLSHEVEGLAVELEIETPGGLRRYEGCSNREGFIHFDVETGEWPLGPHSNWDVVRLKWHNEAGPQSVRGYVKAPPAEPRISVISDIDDTIIETGINKGFRSLVRNWKRVFAQMPNERLQVPEAAVFYAALGGGATPETSAGTPCGAMPPATRRPFFYVSSSPWNLFSYLVAFQEVHDLPLGPIFLRDWSLSRKTFGEASHGGHKRQAIGTILETYPDTRFALIGDDTQGDFAAFADVIEAYPGRVAAVFIRNAGDTLSADKLAAQDAIEASGVPLWTGSDYSTGRAFLDAAGLSHDEDAAQIVETVEKPNAARDKASVPVQRKTR